ncbi:MAG: hypothetical protein JRI85_02900, partial [Deltaproteobacteria bacterium]|nr:hypothetical protein [Deltaproteobacteria bacterium]
MTGHTPHSPEPGADPRSFKELLLHIVQDTVYVVKIALIIDLAAFSLVAAYCWFTGRRSFDEFSTFLQYAAVIILLIGFVLMLSSSNVGAAHR